MGDPMVFRRMVIGLVAIIAGAAGLVAALPLGNSAVADDKPQTHEFTLVAQEVEWELQPGTTVKAWTYNGQMPGPEIRVREGDLVKVTLVNRLPIGTTIHWHGVDVPNAMDGPAGLNQAPIEPGESFTYEFTATPAGTRWYHSHTDPATQVSLGLYGPFIVEPKAAATRYDQEFTVSLSEWDLDLTPAVATGDEPRSVRDQSLPGGQLGADLFVFNGKIHEGIPPLVVKTGDKVLIRLINAGNMPHPFHLHGHSFRIVATDGNPVPPAAQLTKDTVLIAPGERYDLEFDAVNPGVWMIHCHIENHADNGMMTVLQYEGYAPTGPAAEDWATTGVVSMSHSDHASADADVTPVFTVEPVATAEPTPMATTGAETAVAGEEAIVVQMVDNRFRPRNLTVAVGSTVLWVNDGGNWHSVSGQSTGLQSASLKTGETFTHTFTEVGTFRVLCKLHSRQGMVMTVDVVAAPPKSR